MLIRPHRKPRKILAGLRHGGRLKMTSMMDILTVLLLFLLKSFVVDAELVTPAAGVTLPESTSLERPEPTLVVAVLEDAIVVGDRVVVSVEQALAGDGLAITPLLVHLRQQARQTEHLEQLSGSTEETQLKATIQGDRMIPFKLLERVMFTLSQSGYETISLAVIKNV